VQLFSKRKNESNQIDIGKDSSAWHHYLQAMIIIMSSVLSVAVPLYVWGRLIDRRETATFFSGPGETCVGWMVRLTARITCWAWAHDSWRARRGWSGRRDLYVPLSHSSLPSSSSRLSRGHVPPCQLPVLLSRSCLWNILPATKLCMSAVIVNCIHYQRRWITKGVGTINKIKMLCYCR